MSTIFNGHYRVRNQTWLLEALLLHFDEKLSRIEAGRRLGIPKTTVCELFVRFQRAGLSWPLPDSVNLKALNNRFYQQASRKSPVPPPSAEPTAIPAPRRRPRRPNFPREFELLWWKSLCNRASAWHSLHAKMTSMTTCCSTGGAIISRAAGCSGRYADTAPRDADPDRPAKLPFPSSGEPACCELVLPAGTLRICGKFTPEHLQMLIGEMQGGQQ